MVHDLIIIGGLIIVALSTAVMFHLVRWMYWGDWEDWED